MALPGPLPEGSPLTRLRNAGAVTAADDDLDDLPEPVQPPAGMEAPSVLLARLRRDES